MDRRKFLENSSLGATGILAVSALASCNTGSDKSGTAGTMAGESGKTGEGGEAVAGPIALCTWNFGRASEAAWEVLNAGGSSLDAAEAGVRVEESNPENMTVGLGGRPDRDGHVTLDACIMDSDGNCGAVMALEGYEHPVSVARKVMEETPHVILVGEGAAQFAREQGFDTRELLTEAAREEYEEWKKTSDYKPVINIENHDTIGMLTRDSAGNIAGACTTSGLAYKMRGRVGDSPVIGAGLYVDNEVGGATATGMGEEVVRTVGSFLIVELMRQGLSPQAACEEGVRRILAKNKGRKDFQIGFIALNKQGQTGSYCIHPGFSYRLYDADGHRNVHSASFIQPES